MNGWEAIALVLGGGAAGFINALAGGGSAITIPILTEIVGVTTANGTNRIAILFANLSAIAGYRKGGVVEWHTVARLVPPVLAGAAAGAWLATMTAPGIMRRVFAVVLAGVALSVLLRPGRWVQERRAVLAEPWRSLVFAGIGFYGGFVQAGVGFLLLAGLVLGGGLDLVRGNAAKVILIFAYTPIAIVVFAGASQIDFGVGVVLTAGQVVGAWVGSRLAVARGAPWVRWVLVAAAGIAVIRLAFF
ncbi:MAG: sulfite exporter TauE/SafE family protein [Acidimicrobiia bacterium]